MDTVVFRASDHPTFKDFHQWISGGLSPEKPARHLEIIHAYLASYAPRKESLEKRLDELEAIWSETPMCPSCYWGTALGYVCRQTVRFAGATRTHRDSPATDDPGQHQNRYKCFQHLVERGARLQLEKDSVLLHGSLGACARMILENPTDRDSDPVTFLEMIVNAGVDLNIRHTSGSTALTNSILAGAPGPFLEKMVALGATLEKEDIDRIDHGDMSSLKDESGRVAAALDVAASLTAEQSLVDLSPAKGRATQDTDLSL